MLAHGACPVALDDPGPGVLVEEGAHQGGLGDMGDDPVCQFLVGPGGGEVPAKAGAVVADHLEDPPADQGRGVHRRPHRQVAPLEWPPTRSLPGYRRAT